MSLEETALKAYEAIFSGMHALRLSDNEYPLKHTPRSRLRYFEAEGYTFLEQNPRKDSHWGKLAREGHRILWVMKGMRYIATVRDGQYHDLKEG